MLIYTFSYVDDVIEVTFDPVTRFVAPVSRFGYPIPMQVQQSDLGRPEDSIVDSFCQGPDRIILRASLSYPFAYAQIVVNSPECPIVTPDPEPEPDEPPTEPQAERVVYRIRWKNFEETLLSVDIIDRQNYTPGATEKVIPLEGAGNPFAVSVIDNEETPLAPIRAKEGVIRFNSTTTIGLSTFIEGEDNRWYVIAYHGEALPAQIIFQGFLTFSDSQEPFLPAPNEVTLVATDNIGLLKDVPLVKPDGTNPKGTFKIIEYLAWALQKTGLHLSIRLVHNLREVSSPDVPMYESCYLEARTFEDEIGTSISCYEVIERILGEDAFLVQMGGEWWIIRPDEMQGDTYTTWRFDKDGIIVPNDLIQNPSIFEATKYIGENEVRYWSNEATNVLINRPHRQVKEVYRYEYAKELIGNIDFSQGARLFPLGGTFTRDGNPWTWEGYQLSEWDVLQGTFTNPEPAPGTSYVRKEFEFGVERARFAYLQSFSGTDQWIQSTPVPVGKDDRINFSFDFKLPTARGILTGFSLYMHLIHVSENGHVQTLIFSARNLLKGDNPIVWETYTGFTQRVAFEFSRIDADGWTNVTLGDADIVVPADGDLYLLLPFIKNDIINYKDVRFTYHPYINSSLLEFEGQQHKISQPGKYQSAYEGEVYISDSPRKIFKGALLKMADGGKFFLAGNFSHPAYSGYQKPFGWWQAFAAWYLKKRTMRLFEGELRGIDVEDSLSDCVHQWVITDTTEHTDGKTFMLLHYDMDYTDCGGPIVLHEVSDEGQEKTFTDSHEFRYLEKR